MTRKVAQMAVPGPYSELEYLILSLLSQGINSGYAMRKQMSKMRGTRWSADSGSVYRVLRRLEQDGLLKEERKAGVPNRERTEYALTPAGEVLVSNWLLYPPDRADFAFLVDPLRIRTLFLGRLKHAEQIRVVKSWSTENKAFIEELRREATSVPASPWAELAGMNLIYLAEARQDWLRKVLQTLRSHAIAESNARS